MSGNSVDFLSSFELARPLREAGNTDAALVHGRLATSQAAIESFLLSTVVSQENHERVVSEFQLFEFAKQSAEVFVDVLHHRVNLRGGLIEPLVEVRLHKLVVDFERRVRRV